MNTDNTVFSGSSHTLNEPLLDFTDVIIRKELCQKNIKRLWSEKESSLLSEYINQGISLQDISKKLNRSIPAIISKGNELGYGYYSNKEDGLKYFKAEVNHKHRRTKEENLEGKEFLSVVTEAKESQGTDIEVVTDIMPKIEITLKAPGISIEILTTTRDNAISMRTSASTTGGIE